MKFYAIHEGYYEGVQVRIEQLRNACESLGVEFVLLNSLTCDHTSLPKPGKHDLMYNFARGSLTLESILLNKDVTTFYINNPDLSTITSTTQLSILHEKEKIPSPKTIFHLTADRELLKKYIDYLGGFPIIIKVEGGTRGLGTLKIESRANLYSTVDYLLTTGDRFIMREFIHALGVGRCRVLGNEVIQTYEFPLIKDDFRTSSVSFDKLEPVVERSYSKEIENYCIKAAHIANTQFAAVDVMIDKAGNPYILEINFPAGLPLNWKENGNVIALKMIGFLKQKSLSKNG